MQIKLFTIPVLDSGSAHAEMNRFLRNSKILEVTENFVANQSGSYWCFCVRYMDQQFRSSSENKGRVDYKEVLDEPTFMKFTRLREIRKKVAADEGIPAFAIFTDEELAGMAGLQSITRKDMLLIKGIGDKKVERFAHYFIEDQQENETGG